MKVIKKELFEIDLYKILKKKGITASELADMSGIKRPHLTLIKQNKAKVSYEMWTKIRDCLGLVDKQLKRIKNS